MIHAVLICLPNLRPRDFSTNLQDDTVNTSGDPRLTKFYSPLRGTSQAFIQQVFSLVISRSPSLCNFLEAPELQAFFGAKEDLGEGWRIVYRNYATLYFVFVVDEAESGLGILDLIQVFVECLDHTFESVCELDLVFHFDEVHHILSEMIQGGLVLETSVEEISSAVQAFAKARKESFTSANPLSLGIGGTRSVNQQTSLSWLTQRLVGAGMR